MKNFLNDNEWRDRFYTAADYNHTTLIEQMDQWCQYCG